MSVSASARSDRVDWMMTFAARAVADADASASFAEFQCRLGCIGRRDGGLSGFLGGVSSRLGG